MIDVRTPTIREERFLVRKVESLLAGAKGVSIEVATKKVL
jgi:hypothetical protein